MDALLGLSGVALLIIGLVVLIIRLIKKQSKKTPAVLLVIGVVLFIIGMILPSASPKESSSTESSVLSSVMVESEPEETVSATNTPIVTEEQATIATAEDEKNDDVTPKAKSTAVAKESNTNKASYILDADEPADDISDYVVFNEGTEFEERSLIFRVEPGTYQVSNIGSYMSQVNVYKDGEKNTTEEGWEEWVTGDGGGAYPIDVGETVEISIPDGYIIHLDAPAKLNLTQK